MANVTAQLQQLQRQLADAVDAEALQAAQMLDEAWRTTYNEDVPDGVAETAVFAASAHATQRRKSGELYISHPLSVAAAVTEAGFDLETVAAALCHDLIEDTFVTAEELAEQTSPTIAVLVDGVSKVDRVHFASASDAAAASMMKFVVAVVDDVRVLAIKLADRLHNLRTVAALSVARQRRLAREALDVFAPLAHRLGMEKLRRELEDLAFHVDDPEGAKAAERWLALRVPQAEMLGQSIADQLADRLLDLNVHAEVEHRVKHLYSVHTKMMQGIDPDDIVGVRIVVATRGECYVALGAVHDAMPPVPGRLKDMVALPKNNGYQSLHTTVLVEGTPVEVQIRTAEMHARAQFGVAAHYAYKAGQPVACAGAGTDPNLADQWAALSSPDELLAQLRDELAPDDEIVVLTPKGTPVALPAGSTAVDFAYRIHPEVGNSMVAAKIDGQTVPLTRELSTGPEVEIVVAETSSPQMSWLRSARTTRAQSGVRKALGEVGVTHQEIGRYLLEAELASRSMDAESFDMEQLARDNDASSVEELLERVGAGELPEAALQGVPERVPARCDVVPAIEIAACCSPMPADDTAGLQSAAGVVVVHRSTCPTYRSAVRASATQVIELPAPMAAHWVDLRSVDRCGLLRDVGTACAELGITVVNASSRSTGGHVWSRLELDLVDCGHMSALVLKLETIPSVVAVTASCEADVF